jgi:Reverse transcriptase (RNA-dependent DNA polymerase)
MYVIYGIHQSGFLWSDEIEEAVIKLGFEQSDADECVFVLDIPELYMIITIYVDNMQVAATSVEDIDWLYSELSKRYKLRNLAPITRFLGMDRPDIRQPSDICTTHPS